LAPVLLLLGCNSAGAGSANPQDSQAIFEVVRGGIGAERSAAIPVSPVCPGPVAAAVRDQLLAQLPTSLGAYFVSPQLEKEVDLLSKVLSDTKGGPACLYGAGVDWVHLDKISTEGASAAATGQVRVWSRVAQWQASSPKMAEPHNTLDVRFALQRIDGRWLISNYESKFAPGSEP
jgi:hypothetical protein